MAPGAIPAFLLTLVVTLAACDPFLLPLRNAFPIDDPRALAVAPHFGKHVNSRCHPLPSSLNLDPADWQNWPVIPIVPEKSRQVYILGQSLGNDPHAFSVFGDCQSAPKAFLGVYETDPQTIAVLPLNLQETVAWFKGSFNRLSPTVRGGTTTGCAALGAVASE